MAKKSRQDAGGKKDRLATEAYIDMRLEGMKGDIDMRLEGMKGDIDMRLEGMKGDIDMRLEGMKEEMRGETAKILQAVDTVITRFDRMEKEEAAHALLHRRIEDTLHKHGRRIEKLESVVTER